MARPKGEQPPKKSVSVRLDAEMRQMLDALKLSDPEETPSVAMRRALRLYLKSKKDERGGK